MPNSGWLSLSGESSVDLNGGTPVHVLALQTHISAATNPSVRVMGLTFPKRVLYGGSIALAYKDVNPSSVTELSIAWSHSVSFEAEDLTLMSEQFSVAGPLATLVYKLRPGLTLQVKVFW